MAIIFALFTAVSYGVGDFIGGFASRRATVAQVALWSHVIGLLGLLALAPFLAETLRGRDLALGAMGALFGLAGLLLLYRGLAVGPMSVVAPITGVMSAIVPVIWGNLRGEELSALITTGIALGVVAVALIGFSRNRAGVAVTAATVIGAIGSGIGFGAFFIFIAETEDGSAPLPLVAARVVTAGLMAIYTIGRRIGPPPRVTWRLIAFAGVCDSAANVAFQLAAERGLLSVVAVISALYPAGTIILARFVLREQLQRHQLVGLALAAGAVALVSLG